MPLKPIGINDDGSFTGRVQTALTTLAQNANADALAGKAPAAAGVPTGGTAGQVLTKTSGTNYAAGWATPAASSGGSRIHKVNTTDTVNLYTGQWTRVMTVTITSRFQDFTGTFLLNSIGSPRAVAITGKLLVRIKQQDVLGANPIASLYTQSLTSSTADSFMLTLDSVTATNSVVSMWIKVTGTYERVRMYEQSLATTVAEANIVYLSDQPFQAATPTGVLTWVGQPYGDVYLTQAQYDALATKDATTTYFIIG